MNRRELLILSGFSLMSTGLPFRAQAEATASPRRRRLVTVLLRGGMDGLCAVTPYGDPAMAEARTTVAVPRPGESPNAPLDLDGFFSLHPSLSPLKRRFDEGQLAIVHAVGRPRYNGSHFSVQDEMEVGMSMEMGFRSDGWVNRAWSALEGDRPIVAVRGSVPLIARGSAPAVTLAKSSLPDISEEDYSRVAYLYRNNAQLEDAFQRAQLARELAKSSAASFGAKAGTERRPIYVQNTEMVARMMRSPFGPSICCLEVGSWDSHSGQGGVAGKFAGQLSGLGQVLETLATALGPALEDTVIVVFSEFGRTVLENGSKGTDHGWGGVFFVMGGPVNGGKVYGEWPGLVAAATFAKKYLEVTTDRFEVFAEIVRDHMGLDEARIADFVFPQTRMPSRGLGLIRT